MNSSDKKRLERLEMGRQGAREMRIFTQDEDDPARFTEGETVYTRADIATLAATGWVCIVCEYVDREATP